MQCSPIGRHYLLLFEVYADHGVASSNAAALIRWCVVVAGHDDRQHAILEAVAVEDFPEARRDDAANAEIGERPYCLFTAGPRAEITARHHDLCAIERLAVEHEIGDLALAIAPLVEQMLAEPDLVEQQQEARREDDVGIDISFNRQRRGNAGSATAKLVHRRRVLAFATSTKWPAIASLPLPWRGLSSGGSRPPADALPPLEIAM